MVSSLFTKLLSTLFIKNKSPDFKNNTHYNKINMHNKKIQQNKINVHNKKIIYNIT
jgi:hypothetical protein